MCDWNLLLVLLEWSKEETDLSKSITHIRLKKEKKRKDFNNIWERCSFIKNLLTLRRECDIIVNKTISISTQTSHLKA